MLLLSNTVDLFIRNYVSLKGLIYSCVENLIWKIHPFNTICLELCWLSQWVHCVRRFSIFHYISHKHYELWLCYVSSAASDSNTLNTSFLRLQLHCFNAVCKNANCYPWSFNHSNKESIYRELCLIFRQKIFSIEFSWESIWF